MIACRRQPYLILTRILPAALTNFSPVIFRYCMLLYMINEVAFRIKKDINFYLHSLVFWFPKISASMNWFLHQGTVVNNAEISISRYCRPISSISKSRVGKWFVDHLRISCSMIGGQCIGTSVQCATEKVKLPVYRPPIKMHRRISGIDKQGKWLCPFTWHSLSAAIFVSPERSSERDYVITDSVRSM